jgi:septal ring factor EnvC (AmiA/AmiB activator)
VIVRRSIGGAEHRSVVTVLTRPAALRVVAGLCVCALAFIPVVAGAQTTKERLTATREAVDAAAQKWFDAQNRATELDARVRQLEREISDTESRVAAARKQASARALVMYEGASQQYATILGSTAIDTARRAQLVGVANAHNQSAIDELTSSLDDLHAQKHEIDRERANQQNALAEVASERQALDARLALLTTRSQSEARVAALAAARRRAAAPAPARTVSTEAASTSSAPPTRIVPTPVAIVSVPPPPPPGGGVSPHHNDPFLVCTRIRESGGNYGVVSGDGYYGAYQFLPSTWDVTANHAGRPDLVGVLPNRASAYDQDEMAWALYQWQGKAPWGGRC